MILLYKNVTIKVSPKKIPIEEYDNWKISTPLIWKRKFKIRNRSTLRYKMPFWHLIRVMQTCLHAMGFVVPMGGTIVYRTFYNYNEICTKYQLLSIFFYKSYRHPTKGVMFSDTVESLYFVGAQFSWFSWIPSTTNLHPQRIMMYNKQNWNNVNKERHLQQPTCKIKCLLGKTN